MPTPDDDADEPQPEDGEPVRIELTDELDLHSFHARDVPGIVRDYVDHAARRAWPQVRIIHGKGIGAVRDAVHRVLSKHPDVDGFALAGDRSGWGATVARVRPRPVVLRRLSCADSMERITGMLHRAYAPLAGAGMRFVASWQDADETARRCARGETWVADWEGTVIGTITLVPPDAPGGSPWLDRADVAQVGQWAVDPDWQGRGIGRRLLGQAESRARELGARHLALDTSEHAGDLIETCERRGYAFVEHVQWGATNYRSVVMSKPLAGPA